MCNPRAALRLAALFGAVRVVLFMILKWYLKWIIFLKFSCYSFHNHLPQAFALDQRFAAPEFHKQFVIVTLQPLEFTNNLQFVALPPFVIVTLQPTESRSSSLWCKNFSLWFHMRGLPRLCCINLFEQIVRTWQTVVRANWVLLVLILVWVVQLKRFQLIYLTSLFWAVA